MFLEAFPEIAMERILTCKEHNKRQKKKARNLPKLHKEYTTKNDHDKEPKHCVVPREGTLVHVLAIIGRVSCTLTEMEAPRPPPIPNLGKTAPRAKRIGFETCRWIPPRTSANTLRVSAPLSARTIRPEPMADARTGNPRFRFEHPEPFTEDEKPPRVSPVIVDGPIPPYHALYYYSSVLSPFELTEILQYPRISYIGFAGRKIAVNWGDPRNCGFDTADGQYRVVFGDHIVYRFEVKTLLGSGRHSRVVLCRDHETKTDVAVKILTCTPDAQRRNSLEQMILAKAKRAKVTTIVQAMLYFTFRNHLCITFEILGRDVDYLMRTNPGRMIPMRLVRCISQDVVNAMNFYTGLGIVHCAITGKSVMLVPGTNAEFKLIDFSHAFLGQTAPREWFVDVPREYRPPEMILGLGFGVALDMWCLACLIVEATSGKRLFVAKDDINQLATFVELFGSPTPEFIESVPRSDDFWDPNTRRLYPECLEEKKAERSLNLRTFLNTNDNQLIDFLTKIFVWDPSQRLTPEQALEHPFISNQEARLPDLPSPRK